MTAGAIVGFIAITLVVALVAGLRVLDTGLSEVSVKAIAVIGTIVNILFAIRIDAGTTGGVNISIFSGLLSALSLSQHVQGNQVLIGMGLLYPTAYDIFVVSNMGLLGYIGFIFITGLSVLALVSGILIAFSGASVD
jgi:hypothetical protein